MQKVNQYLRIGEFKLSTTVSQVMASIIGIFPILNYTANAI